jgi:hypothetical protein
MPCAVMLKSSEYKIIAIIAIDCLNQPKRRDALTKILAKEKGHPRIIGDSLGLKGKEALNLFKSLIFLQFAVRVYDKHRIFVSLMHAFLQPARQ